MYVMAAAQIHAVFLGYYLLEFRKKIQIVNAPNVYNIWRYVHESEF
jgi:hypothetical protein